MKKIIISVLILITTLGHSQTLQYNVLAKKDKIGTLKVVQTNVNDELHFEVSANISVRIVKMMHVKYKLNCTYKKNILINSYVTTYVNGKLHSSTKINKENEYYNIIKDEKESKWNALVHYSAVMLYAIEPTNGLIVFSEKNAATKHINKTNIEHLYQLINPKKKKQYEEYQYKNGILQKATIHHPLITFYLVKV